MKAYVEPLTTVPTLSGLSKRVDDFRTDAAGEECLELLEHLVARFREEGSVSCAGLEDACIFLLEHLAARLEERTAGLQSEGKLRLIQ